LKFGFDLHVKKKAEIAGPVAADDIDEKGCSNRTAQGYEINLPFGK
jgi:hypothetical protein